MFYAYIIRSSCGRYYIGSTKDCAKRLEQHNAGESRWTSRYKNWEIVHTEKFATRAEAVSREKALKRLKGGDAFKRIVNDAE